MEQRTIIAQTKGNRGQGRRNVLFWAWLHDTKGLGLLNLSTLSWNFTLYQVPFYSRGMPKNIAFSNSVLKSYTFITQIKCCNSLIIPRFAAGSRCPPPCPKGPRASTCSQTVCLSTGSTTREPRTGWPTLSLETRSNSIQCSSNSFKWRCAGSSAYSIPFIPFSSQFLWFSLCT